jgi:hypothetical protein
MSGMTPIRYREGIKAVLPFHFAFILFGSRNATIIP